MPTPPKGPIKQYRGFAVIKDRDPEFLSSIAKKGGQAAHEAGTAHKFTQDEAKAAGRKGGLATAASRAARRGAGIPGQVSLGLEEVLDESLRTTKADDEEMES